MASEYTTYYNLDLYTDSDKPNLRDQYNGAVNKIDTQLHVLADSVAVASTGATQATSAAKEAKEAADAATKAVADETTARTDADSAIETKLAAETKARTDADSALNTRVTALESGTGGKSYSNIVCIGDSWLEGYSSIGTYTSWGTLLARDLGAEVYNSYKGACGFSVKSDGINFTSLVSSAKNSVTDATAVDCVVIGGGINDRKTGVATVKSAAATCISTAINAFPNADIYVFPMMLAGRFISNSAMSVMRGIEEGCASVNSTRVVVYGDCYDWIYDDSSMQADSYHPNQAGHNLIADYMRQVMFGGNPVAHEGQVSISGANSYSLLAGSFVRRSGTMCSGYIGTTGSPTDGTPFITIGNGYTPGNAYAQYLNNKGDVKPMNTKSIGSDNWGFAPAYGDASQIYATASWSIQDTE
nr:MAG TPA: hypothetical protein [Bacteriophage sp.]